METPKLFLTDYASYNNGTQFEFGHWVDLTDFSNSEEFLEYINDHFKEADKKSPLPDGSPREEIMFTDYENFPEFLYGESMSPSDLEKLFEYVEIYDKLEDADWIDLHNTYCSETGDPDSQIFVFDDEFFDMFFDGKPMEAARAASFGNINWSDEYITFNGYGNLESINERDIERHIDKEEIIEDILENPQYYNL